MGYYNLSYNLGSDGEFWVQLGHSQGPTIFRKNPGLKSHWQNVIQEVHLGAKIDFGAKLLKMASPRVVPQGDQPENPILSIWAPRVIFEPKQISGVAFCQWFFGARIFLKSGDHWECLTQVSFFSLLFCQRKAKQPSANAGSKFSLFPSAAPT